MASVDRNDCVEWTRARSSNGYGRRWYKGREWLAHRAEWDEKRGPIPPGMFVLHKCDNPPCRFIGHLFLGTHPDNMTDMVTKGRGVVLRGSENPESSLTPEQVADVRKLYAGGATQDEIAVRFGVNQATISRAARGVTYGELGHSAATFNCGHCGRTQPRAGNRRRYCNDDCSRSYWSAVKRKAYVAQRGQPRV